MKRLILIVFSILWQKYIITFFMAKQRNSASFVFLTANYLYMLAAFKLCPDFTSTVSWNRGCMWTCCTASSSFSPSPPRTPLPSPHPTLPNTPHHLHPHPVPQCVWLVAQTLSIRIALQCSSEEGKKEHISAICAEHCSFLYAHKETTPRLLPTQEEIQASQ